jgi:hypothetical protein
MKDGLGKLAAKELAKSKLAKPVPVAAATPKMAPAMKPEPGFWDWLGDLFSF